MPDAPRCDVAVWDVDGELAGGVRKALSGAVRRLGAKIETTEGDWLGRRVVVGRPRRVTAARQPTLAEGIAMLDEAHRPERLFVVGPAGSGESGLPIGAVAWVERGGAERAEARWLLALREATSARSSLETLAVITRAGKATPTAHRTTLARRMGRLVGSYLRGASPPSGPDAAGEVLERLARRLEGAD